VRFVPTNCLRDGMVLAKTLYGKNNEKLLTSGAVITENYINSIRRLKYSGIYIEDNVSQDIKVANIISENLRMQTINGVKKLFLQVEKGVRQKINQSEIKRHVESIVDELLQNKDMMVNMIDLKWFDDYTYYHSVNVAVLSIIIGMKLGLSRAKLIELGLGSLMHDIGKVFVNKDIINKPDKLNPYEFEEIKTHSLQGYKYLMERSELPTSSFDAILDHHEKFDGTGYPNGKKNVQISLFGRIAAVSDVYDALTSERPYRKALDPSDSMEYIMGGSGSLFDPKIVNIFIRKIAPYPVGTLVNLSNGYTGIITENFESFCLRPCIRILKIDNEEVTPFEISLKDDFNYLNVTIVSIVDEK